MLVYAKNPMGIIYINDQPIYGRAIKMDPVDIPFEIYNRCLDALEDATIREGYLRTKFKGPFNESLAFTYNEVKLLPQSTLEKIAKGMCLPYETFKTQRQLVENIKFAIRNVTSSS
jgi:hypothetical protein